MGLKAFFWIFYMRPTEQWGIVHALEMAHVTFTYMPLVRPQSYGPTELQGRVGNAVEFFLLLGRRGSGFAN